MVNSGLAAKYGGTWSYFDLHGATRLAWLDIPTDHNGFNSYMRAQPFIVITKGTTLQREEMAASLLKQTFAYNFTRIGWTRALFEDGFRLFSQREYDLAEAVEEVVQIRTVVLLEVNNSPPAKHFYLQSLMQARNDSRRFTIITLPSAAHISNLPEGTTELLRSSARVITLGG